MLQCLRELRIVGGNYSDDRYGYRDLSQATFFRNVRILQIGTDQGSQNYFGETTEAASYYDRMPFLEELHIYNGIHNFEDSFPHLRRLTIYHYPSEYPMAVLANTTSLENLTHLALWPRGMSNDAPGEIGLNEDGGYARISRTGAITLLRSSTFSRLQSLMLRNSDLGDEGIRVLVETGWLRRLKTLDLLGGCVTDVGARLLAESPDIGHLESLNLSHNMLTQDGIEALRRPGLALVADDQHGPEAFQMYEYLYEGDCE
jgi:hypothetical protein